MAEDLLHGLIGDAAFQQAGGRLSPQVVKTQVGDLGARTRPRPPVLDRLGHARLAEGVPET